jgi:hypothetical protein
MSETWRILFGAAFTVLFCWAAGRVLLAWIYRGFSRVETNLLAIPCGAAAVSLFVFGLCAAGVARKGVILWVGLATIGLAVWRTWRTTYEHRLPSLPKLWLVLLIVVIAPFFFVYFLHGLAPEVSPDGVGYHLGNVRRIWLERGFVWDYHNMYCYLSQGFEMLFLVAFEFGRHSAAALVHVAFQLILPILLVTFGLRTGYPRAGCFAAVVAYTSPVVGLDGSIAYNDVGLATVLMSVLYLLHVLDEENNHKLLFLVGLLCGFSYGIKYTALGITAVAVAYVGFVVYRRRGPWATSLALVLAGAAVTASPWVLRNWIWLGNPLAPFFNAWFPNPYYHPGMEQIYREGLAHYEGIPHLWQIPLELTVHGGGNVGGMLGPVFLLAPLALLALRYPLGRLLLFTALVLALPATQNTGSRFLIPALPFVAMAMGIAIGNSPGVAPALAIFHAVLCWPTVLPLYCHKYAWRLGPPNLDASFRRIPEMEWVGRHALDVALAPQIHTHVRPDRKIYSFAGRPEAYLDREILVSYESAEANLLNDILLAPLHGYKPTAHRRFEFPARAVEAVRVAQTAASPSFWSVAEVRVYAGGREVPRAPSWRLQAHPNGWEVQLAFDNSPVTRWSSWEPSRPGQSIEIRFGRAETIDAVVVESAAEGYSKLRLEGRGSDGRWVELAAQPQTVDVDPPRGMRLAATREVKARGVSHLLIQETDFFYQDALRHLRYWGLTEIGQANGTHFYRID